MRRRWKATIAVAAVLGTAALAGNSGDEGGSEDARVGAAAPIEARLPFASTSTTIERTTTTSTTAPPTTTTTTTTAPPPPPTTTTAAPPPPAPRAVAAAPAPAPASDCHPSYDPCLPITSDLDCPEIGHRVGVIGPDDYRLDSDDDGLGCESY